MDMPEQASDDELIAATLEGQLEAFDQLMERYQGFVYRLAFGFGRSHDNALDVSQAVFLKVFRKLASFGGRSSFRTWLAKVVYHEGLNWQRANRRHAEGHEELVETVDSSGLRQDEQLLVNERFEKILKGLARLNRRYRTAVELRYFHGLPVREIAVVLECSEGVAKNALFRGVRTLRNHLSEAGVGA